MMITNDLAAAVARLRAWIERSPETQAMLYIDLVLSALEAAQAKQSGGNGVIGSLPGHTEGQKMPGPLDPIADLCARLRLEHPDMSLGNEAAAALADMKIRAERAEAERDEARATDDLVQIAKTGSYHECSEALFRAHDLIERQAREIAEWKRKYSNANEWGLRNAAAWKDRAERAEAERDKLQKQLPAEMPDSTIVFMECPKGHGRLTANNWIDHGCPYCERDALRECVKAADFMRTREEHSGSSPGCVSCEAIAAYDAARAKVTT